MASELSNNVFTRMTMAMCGDDDVARNGGETDKGALSTWRSQHRGVSVDAVHRQAISKIRLRFESLPTPPCRGKRGVDISGCQSAAVELVHRRTAHRGLGLGLTAEGEECRRHQPLWVGERGCQYGAGVNGERHGAHRH